MSIDQTRTRFTAPETRPPAAPFDSPRAADWNERLRSLLLDRPALPQAVYYGLTGLWPWVSMSTFLAVTGPKTDLWLVRTVGALIVIIAVALGVATWQRERSWGVTVLGIGSAVALLFVDVLFVSLGTIPPVYLLDAMAEAGVLAFWVAGWRTPRDPCAEVLEHVPVARVAPVPGPAPSLTEPTLPWMSPNDTLTRNHADDTLVAPGNAGNGSSRT